jgi:hypothetical protein
MNPCCLSGKLFGHNEIVRHFVRSDEGEIFPVHHDTYAVLQDSSMRLALDDEDAVVIVSSASTDVIDMIVSARFIRQRWSKSVELMNRLQSCRAATAELQNQLESKMRLEALREAMERARRHTDKPRVEDYWVHINDD